MQSVPILFFRLHCEGYIADLLLGMLAGSLKSYPPFWKARGSFWGNDLYGALVYEPKFKTGETNSRAITSEPSIIKLIENKSDLSKLSTFSDSSIVKFIEKQSEHLSKLTLYHLKKRATRRSRRAREPNRIPLLFLRDLNKKNIMSGRNFSSKRFQRLRYRSLQNSTAMLIRLENFIMHDINVITNAIQRINKMAIMLKLICHNLS